VVSLKLFLGLLSEKMSGGILRCVCGFMRFLSNWDGPLTSVQSSLNSTVSRGPPRYYAKRALQI
jgi:hypothetical protein